MSNSKRYSTQRNAPRKAASPTSRSWAPLALALGIAFLPGCAKKTACLKEPGNTSLACSPDKLFAEPKRREKTLTVTAMAYTAQSVHHFGKSLPRAANGQCLTPDACAIAVSPDLVDEYGLDLDKTVRISGLEGEFKVMDLMSPRHSKSIDIYFGNDQAAARQWGKRVLTLTWE
jgi:3D (Asp-Asp-Asp) domain-containing protein